MVAFLYMLNPFPARETREFTFVTPPLSPWLRTWWCVCICCCVCKQKLISDTTQISDTPLHNQCGIFLSNPVCVCQLGNTTGLRWHIFLHRVMWCIHEVYSKLCWPTENLLATICECAHDLPKGYNFNIGFFHPQPLVLCRFSRTSLVECYLWWEWLNKTI